MTVRALSPGYRSGALAAARGADDGRVDLDVLGRAERGLVQLDIDPDHRVLAPAGATDNDTVDKGLVADGPEHADRIALEREQDTVLEQEGRRMVRLPYLADGTESGGITVLSQAVADQGMV